MGQIMQTEQLNQSDDVGDLSRSGSVRLFMLVFAPLVLLYLGTATWSLPYHIDPASNVFTAWELGEHGDVLLEQHEALATDDYFGTIGWIVPAGESAASLYPPGTAFLAAPLYAVWSGEAMTQVVTGANNVEAAAVEIPIPPLAPAAIVASTVTAIAVGLLALTFRQLVGGRTALIAAYVAGLGTGLWSIAADALWQHGPSIMWIAGGLMLSANYQAASGFAFGAAILTRPHTALIAAGNGLAQAWECRSWRPAIRVGLGSATGLGLLIWFNNAVFGSPSVAGGYGDRFAERMASLDLLDYAGNILLVFVHPLRGLLVFSPFLILLIPGLRAAWQAAPGWVRGSAIGGLLYLLLQLKAEGYSGGSSFWGYRYPLETLAAAAPLLLLAYTEWVERQSELIRKLFRWLLIASVLLTAAGAIAY